MLLPQIPQIDFPSTEMVHAIFDRSVGNCYGSFPCTYSRQHGRVYVASTAVLFYSNIFGFERRLCMSLAEVTEVKTYRSTSIWISMIDGEDFVFKSLSNRERIVAVIHALLRNFSPRESSTSVQVEVDTAALAQLELTPSANSARSRARAHSCPIEINQEVPFAGVCGVGTQVDLSGVEPARKTSNGDVSFATSTCTEGLLEGWKKEKLAQKSSFKQRAVDDFKLNCSLSDFFDRFLADDAPHSLASYQENVIGDTQVKATNWILADNDCMTRTISFCHPIGNNFGIGPSSTMATRKQILHRYGDFGLSLATTTNVIGIPASDAFHVADQWLVEQISSDQICFTALHGIIFTKRTVFKRLIETSTTSEIQKWYKGYITMLMNQIEGQQKGGTIVSLQHVVDEPETARKLNITYLGAAVIVALFALFCQNYILQSQVHQLQAELNSIQLQQAISLQLIKDSISRGSS